MRRLTFLLFLAIAAVGCVSPAWAKGIVFVLNSAGASISVIDMSTQKEVRRIPVLREPHHLALSPDGHSLLVTFSVPGNQNNVATTVEPDQRAVAAIQYTVQATGGDVRVVVQSELVANEPLPDPDGDPRAAAALRSSLRSERVDGLLDSAGIAERIAQIAVRDVKIGTDC